MRLNFNRYSVSSQWWKNAISTGNFYRIRICLIFLQILQRWQSKAKSLVFPTMQELFLYVTYLNAPKHIKVRLPFLYTLCIYIYTYMYTHTPTRTRTRTHTHAHTRDSFGLQNTHTPYARDSFGLQNTKEYSMTCRQSETYSDKYTSKTYHYSLFHPRGIFRW